MSGLRIVRPWKSTNWEMSGPENQRTEKCPTLQISRTEKCPDWELSVFRLLTYLVELGIETRSLNVGRIISALCAHWFRRILHIHQLWLQTALLWSPAKLLSPSVCCLVPSPGAWVIQLSSIIEVIIGYMALLLSLCLFVMIGSNRLWQSWDEGKLRHCDQMRL